MKRNLIMILHTFVFVFIMATASIAQPQDADFFGIEGKITFQDTVIWIGFDAVVSIDIVNKRVDWIVYGYNQSFELIISQQVGMDFPSQALPLKNLKSKMKDESADVLGLVYNGLEQ